MGRCGARDGPAMFHDAARGDYDVCAACHAGLLEAGLVCNRVASVNISES